MRRRRIIFWWSRAGMVAFLAFLVGLTMFNLGLFSEQQTAQSMVCDGGKNVYSFTPVSIDDGMVDNQSVPSDMDEEFGFENEVSNNHSTSSFTESISENIQERQESTESTDVESITSLDQNPNLESNSPNSKDVAPVQNTTECVELELLDLSEITPIEITLVHPAPGYPVEFEKPEEFKPYFEVGGHATVSSSWIIDNDVRTGFRANSLVQNELSIGYSAGLDIAYHSSKNSSWWLDYDFLYRLNQNYSYYNEGRISQRNWKLGYEKVALGYSYNHRNNLKPMEFNFSAGVFGAVSIKDVTTVNDQLDLGLHDRFDFGLRFGIGHTYRHNRIRLRFGLQGDVGLRNIATDSQPVPKKFNRTTTLNVGPYLGLRFQL